MAIRQFLIGHLLPEHQEALDLCVGGLQGVAGLEQRVVQLLQGLAHHFLPERHGQQMVHLLGACETSGAWWWWRFDLHLRLQLPSLARKIKIPLWQI